MDIKATIGIKCKQLKSGLRIEDRSFTLQQIATRVIRLRVILY